MLCTTCNTLCFPDIANVHKKVSSTNIQEVTTMPNARKFRILKGKVVVERESVTIGKS